MYKNLTEHTLETIEWAQHCTVELIDDILEDDESDDKHSLCQDDVEDLCHAMKVLTQCVSLKAALSA